ncbi:hypothetical protein O181_037250 [Austropuccinia psidii MF-1]|uniref:Uncharacterized protein n=1 Tax=Austropuccinia psidii MF-1 TaxID=1389203 RepID=A0A9Q3D7W6_9BASI|nr:hypothetical protein [Austropuccinia psidii MF-1]
MVTSLLDWSKVIIQPMKNGNGKRTFKLGLIVTHGIQMSKKLAPSPFLEPSQHYEPPIPRPSQSSKSQVTSHEDGLTHEPEPEVAPMQSTEEPFAHPATPCSVIIINNTPIGSPLEIPTAFSPHSHDEAWQEFTDLQLTLIIP